MSTKKVNCLNIAFVFRSSVGSINGSWTEGNVTTVKKITLPDGRRLPYVSGQSLKYQIRRYWAEAGASLSPAGKSDKDEGVNFTAGEPAKYLDDDLLGYMIASKNENRRRTAVVRTSAAIGIFPFQGDRDLGTKSKEKEEGDMGAGGNMFETEIYYNYFRVNILVELDRLGNFQAFELGKKEKSENLKIEERRSRVEALLDAVEHLWGGGKQSRVLSDISPQFVALTFQTVKSPIFLETLTVKDDETLHTEAVNQVLNDYANIITHKATGVRAGIFKNEVAKEVSGTQSIHEAFEAARTYLKTLDF
jgi:CRISPR-associated protein Cst2